MEGFKEGIQGVSRQQTEGLLEQPSGKHCPDTNEEKTENKVSNAPITRDSKKRTKKDSSKSVKIPGKNLD